MRILLTTTSFQDTPGKHHEVLKLSGFDIATARGPLTEKQMLDLSDPFTHKESWRPFRPEDVRDARLLQLHAELRNSVGDTASVEAEGVYSRREAALEHYRRGDFRGAEELLQALLHEGFEAPSTHCHLPLSVR